MNNDSGVWLDKIKGMNDDTTAIAEHKHIWKPVKYNPKETDMHGSTYDSQTISFSCTLKITTASGSTKVDFGLQNFKRNLSFE
jgi:type II secretory pathway component HofQ